MQTTIGKLKCIFAAFFTVINNNFTTVKAQWF